jgi:hypothetical protein
MNLVFDIEADGLLDSITKIHCIVTKNIDTQEVKQFTPENIYEGVDYLAKADGVIGHNIISYDLPALDKLCGTNFKWGWLTQNKFNVVDTFIMSRTLDPDRPIPFGYKGRGKTHSLECWGYRVGRWKPEHNEWSEFTEEMLHRCTEDVEINYLTYLELMKEVER